MSLAGRTGNEPSEPLSGCPRALSPQSANSFLLTTTRGTPQVTEQSVDRILRFEGQPDKKVIIRLSYPHLQADDSTWECRYIVETTDGVSEKAAYGVDGIQALQCALIMLSGEVSYLERKHNSKLVCLDGADSGFPVPSGQ